MSKTAWPKGSYPHRLSKPGTHRVELMTPEKAHILNSERKRSGYSGAWERDNKADPNEVVVREAISSEERKLRFREGLQRDSENTRADREPEEESLMSNESTAVAERPVKKATKTKQKVVPAKKPESTKTSKADTWHDIPTTALIRHCGSEGYNTKQTKAVIAHAGLKTTDSTIGSNLSYGRQMAEGKKKPAYLENYPSLWTLPKISKELAAEIKRVAKSVPEDEPPVKKAPAKKSSKEKAPRKKIENRVSSKPAKTRAKKVEEDLSTDEPDEDLEGLDDMDEE